MSQALQLIEHRNIGAAVLDENLIDGVVTPLAQRLIALGIPFVLHSGTDIPLGLAGGRADIVEVPKPADPWVVMDAVEYAIARAPALAL